MALLAHLYSHIRGSQEDVATLSLQYIVSRSEKLKEAFTRILFNSLHADRKASLNYICQSAGEKRERPDIAGIDENGKEVLLCEAKFYAGLTENQPNAYLDRLIKEGGVGLVFICPDVRLNALWNTLMNLCREREVKLVDRYCASIDATRMSILSWNQIIEELRKYASGLDESIKSDIEQLSSFCEQMDAEAFIPFTSEELGAIVPRLEERHYRVMDELFHALLNNKSVSASAKGLRATPNRNGYVRYITVNQYSLALSYDRNIWMKPDTADTPFWVAITAGNWKQPEEYQMIFNTIPSSNRTNEYNATYLALYPLTNAVLTDVVEDLMEQVLRYIQMLDRLQYNNPFN